MLVKLLACTAVVAGCTHHRPIAAIDTELDSQTRVTINEGMPSETEVIALVGPNGLYYLADNGGYVAAGNVRTVTETRRLRGAGEGFLIGAGVGFAGGAALGLADGDDPPCTDTEWCYFNLTAGEKAVLGGILLGGLGGIVGAAIGALKGSDIIYDNGEGVTVSATAPPGSQAGMTVTF